MKQKIWSAVAVFAVLLGTGSLRAHHYSAGIFDLSKPVTLNGTLSNVDWRNPHIEVSVEVKGDGGAVATWKIESMAPSFFRTRNISRSDFDNAIGHAVVIEAVRAKDGSPYGLLQKITFPDGKSVAVPGQNQTDSNRKEP